MNVRARKPLIKTPKKNYLYLFTYVILLYVVEEKHTVVELSVGSTSMGSFSVGSFSVGSFSMGATVASVGHRSHLGSVNCPWDSDDCAFKVNL